MKKDGGGAGAGVFHGEIHWLIPRVFATDEGAEGDGTHVAVELELAGGGGEDGGAVAAGDGFAAEELDEAEGDGGAAVFFLDGEEAGFAPGVAGGEVGLEVGEFGVEGKGALEAEGDHAGEFLTGEADAVDVIAVEFVHEATVGGAVVLGDFLGEGAVVEPVALGRLSRSS